MNYFRTVVAFVFGAIAGISVFKGLGYAILGKWIDVAFSGLAFIIVLAIGFWILSKYAKTFRKLHLLFQFKMIIRKNARIQFAH